MPYKPLIIDTNGAYRTLPDGDTVVGSGDMYKSVYDPTDKALDLVTVDRPVPGDAFDRRNHHGTVNLSDVSGLGTAATANIGTGPTDVAAGDHIHLVVGPDMLSSIYDPQDWGLATPTVSRPVPGDVFDRRNHYGIIPAGSVTGIGTAGAANIGTGPTDVAAGDHSHAQTYLETSLYDPQNITDDIFARANHTGTQHVSTITGLGNAALLNLGTSSNTVAEGSHNHDSMYMLTSIYDPGNIGGNAFDRANHTGTQTLGTISDADMVGATATSPGRKGVVPEPQPGQQSYFLRGDATWAENPTTGIMTSAVYDTDGDGIIDNAQKLDGKEATYYLDRSNHTGTQDKSTITGLDIYELVTSRGVANGYASLDDNGKLPLDVFPTEMRDGLKFKGFWNVASGPLSGTFVDGDFYRVSVGGTASMSGESETDWEVGDWVVYENDQWFKLDNSDKITSVNGMTGDVVLTLDNIINTGNAPTPNQILQYNGDGPGWVLTNALAGDMLASVYDSNGDGIVDDAANLGGQPPSYYLDRSNHTGTIPVANVTGIGPIASASFGTTEGTVAEGNHNHDDVYFKKDNNLSELTNASDARTNLGLTSIATANFGNTPGTVAEGSHTHSIDDLEDISNSTHEDLVIGFMDAVLVEYKHDYGLGYKRYMLGSGTLITSAHFVWVDGTYTVFMEQSGFSGYIICDEPVSGNKESAYVIIEYTSNILLNSELVVSVGNENAAPITENSPHPDVITLTEHHSFNNGSKVASGDVMFTGSGDSMFWRIDTSNTPSDFTIRSVIFGYGYKTKSYLNVEETRTKPLSLDTYTEKVHIISNSSGNLNIDRNNANIQAFTLTGTTTFSFTGFKDGYCTSITLFITNGGGKTVNWPGNLEWINGIGEIMLKDNGTDIVTITSIDGGDTLYGTYVQ